MKILAIVCSIRSGPRAGVRIINKPGQYTKWGIFLTLSKRSAHATPEREEDPPEGAKTGLTKMKNLLRQLS